MWLLNTVFMSIKGNKILPLFKRAYCQARNGQKGRIGWGGWDWRYVEFGLNSVVFKSFYKMKSTLVARPHLEREELVNYGLREGVAVRGIKTPYCIHRTL